jgi:hypothetical protein
MTDHGNWGDQGDVWSDDGADGGEGVEWFWSSELAELDVLDCVLEWEFPELSGEEAAFLRGAVLTYVEWIESLPEPERSRVIQWIDEHAQEWIDEHAQE